MAVIELVDRDPIAKKIDLKTKEKISTKEQQDPKSKSVEKEIKSKK